MISLRGEIGDGRQLGEGGEEAEAGDFYLPNKALQSNKK